MLPGVDEQGNGGLMTDEELKEEITKIVAGFWEGKPLTKEDLVKWIPFEPWSTWNTPYFTFDRMKAFVLFRYERMGDTSFTVPYAIIKGEEDVRRELKKLKKQARQAGHENKKGPPQGGPMGGSSNSTGV
jgi:hypothetical protein